MYKCLCVCLCIHVHKSSFGSKIASATAERPCPQESLFKSPASERVKHIPILNHRGEHSAH